MRLSGSHTLEVAASRKRCLAVILDLAAYPAWFPGVKTVRVLRGSDRAPTARMLFSAGIPAVPDVQCTLCCEPRPPGLVVLSALSGPLQLSGEGWRLEADDPGGLTRVTYDIEVQMNVPGGPVAERLLRSRARHFLLEEPVAALKRRAEGTG